MNFIDAHVQGVSFFALLSLSLIWGVANFNIASISSKYTAFLTTSFLYVSMLTLVSVLLLFQSEYGTTRNNLLLFLVGGVSSTGYLFMVYGMSKGTISVVAPLAGLFALIVPAVGGIFAGDHVQALEWFGVLAAITAVVCISWKPNTTEEFHHIKERKLSIFCGVMSGILGGFYSLSLAKIDSPAISKAFFFYLTAAIAGLSYIVYKRKSISSILDNRIKLKKLLLIILFFSLFYISANLIFSWGSKYVPVVIASVLGSLYPAVTVILAWIIRKEKIFRIQQIGFVAGALAVVLIALGK